MFQKVVTFEDFNGEETNEKLSFNLTAPELAGLEFEFDEGFEDYVRKAVAEGSNKKLFDTFKLLMAHSYGRFSEDGKRFIKKSEWLDELFCGLAYEELFIWLFSNPSNAAKFFVDIQPKNLEKRIMAHKPSGEEKDSKPNKKLQDMTRAELEAAFAAKMAEKKPANEVNL